MQGYMYTQISQAHPNVRICLPKYLVFQMVFWYDDWWLFYITNMHNVEVKSPTIPPPETTSSPVMVAPWVGLKVPHYLLMTDLLTYHLGQRPHYWKTLVQAASKHFPYPGSAAKSLQSCPTLCSPIDGSPPGPAVPGILQARTLEWVAISSSNAWKWKVKVKSFSHVRLLATPWTAAYQAPPSTGFSRQEYWSGVPLPSPGSGDEICRGWYFPKLEISSDKAAIFPFDINFLFLQFLLDSAVILPYTLGDKTALGIKTVILARSLPRKDSFPLRGEIFQDQVLARTRI